MAEAPARRQIGFTGPGGGDGDGGLGTGETLSETEIIEVEGLIGNYFVDAGGSATQDSRTLPKNLSGNSIYSNQSEISNASDSISGISSYNNVGRITRCYNPNGDGFRNDFDTSADCGVVFVSAPNVIGVATASLPPERRVGYGQTAVGVIYEFNRDGYEGFVEVFNDNCVLSSNPYRGFNEVGIITGRSQTPFNGKVRTNSDGTIIAAVVSKRSGTGALAGNKVIVYQRGRGETGTASYKRMGDLDGSEDEGYTYDVAVSGDGKIILVSSINEQSGGCDGTITGVVYVYERNKANYSLLGSIDPGAVIGRKGKYPNSTNFGTRVATNMDGSIVAVGDNERMYIFNRTTEYYNNYYGTGCEFERLRDRYVPYIVTQVIDGVSPLKMTADGRTIVLSIDNGGGACFTNGRGNEYISSGKQSNKGQYGSSSDDGKTVILADESGSVIYKIEGNTWYEVSTIATQGKVKMSADGKYVMDSTGNIWHQQRQTYVYADENGNIGILVSDPNATLDVGGSEKVRGSLDVVDSVTIGGNLSVAGTFTSPAGGFSGTFNGTVNGNASSATTASGLTGTPNITVNDIIADELNCRRVETTGAVVVGGNLNVTGTKSFDIPHPSKEGWRLKYICLEGPTADVYVRGKLEDSNVIELPDYWADLVDQETIMVSLTPFGVYQELFVEKVEWGKKIVVKNNLGGPIKCSYVVYAERKDVDRNQAEYQP